MADTSALIALMDADDRHHEVLRELFETQPDEWLLPWAVLPEIDYLLQTRGGSAAQLAFVRDLAEGRLAVEWGSMKDLVRARDICERYRTLSLGLVDAVVMSIAERLAARAIATLDLRHFGAVKIQGGPTLLPRDA